MHLKIVKRLSKQYLEKCIEVYGESKHHQTTPYIEYQPYVYSVYCKDDNPEAEYIFDYNTIVIYYKNIEDTEHLARTILHEYQHYLQSPSWMTRYYNMGHYYSDHPYEVAAFAEEENWRKIA
jgi:hypothetical protein|tara:strand:- start:2121 stop:2486 length:366 start_codon:yes stop_codon:yes gene_type:complete